MPVVAAVEDRVQRARAEHVLRAGERMRELVRIFACQMAKREVRESRGEGGRQLSGGHREGVGRRRARIARAAVDDMLPAGARARMNGEDARRARRAARLGGDRAHGRQCNWR
ncbi:hypothetical protein DP59_5889 [Burkholderia pseudomallei]|nr:hypothetical protein DP59_5889 [Burkholderia pseudomallei]